MYYYHSQGSLVLYGELLNGVRVFGGLAIPCVVFTSAVIDSPLQIFTTFTGSIR